MIYFIQEGQDGPIKIGYSKNPEKRLRALQTSSPNQLRLLLSLPGTHEEESKLQDMFASSRLEGEWFTPTDELNAFIENPVSALLAGRAGEEDEIIPGSKYAFRKYKKMKHAMEAWKALGIFHETRRTFLDQIVFWLRYRKHVAWGQIRNKRAYVESRGGIRVNPSAFIGLIGIKAGASGLKAWYPPAGFSFDYYYEDDIWQFFPWIIGMDDSKELLQKLERMQCACGGDLGSHSRKCDFHDNRFGFYEDFLHLKSGPAEVRIYVNPELIFDSETLCMSDDVMA